MSKFDAILKRIEEQMPSNVQQNVTGATNPQQTNPSQPTNAVKTSTGQDPAKVAQSTGFSITHPDTAKAMQALADTKSMADVTKALSDPNIQKVIQGFLGAYKQ